MRIWLSGPRLFRGLVRPGISLGKEDLRAIRKTPAMAVTAAIALFRRKDGAILMAIGDKSGAPVQTDMPDISMADMPPVAVFSFPSTPAAVDVREGARARLAKHIGQDGLVVGQSVGQVVAAIKAEMTALDVEGKFVRVEIETAPEPASHSTDQSMIWARSYLRSSFGG